MTPEATEQVYLHACDGTSVIASHIKVEMPHASHYDSEQV
jgi:hypothetical protein